MTSPVAGIDPHQGTFTVGIIDPFGVEVTHESFPNRATGYAAALDLLATHGVELVGIEGSASWGAHVAIALVAAGIDARDVPPSRMATQRRSRRHAKTDSIDSVAVARAVQVEPDLPGVQTLEVYDPVVAHIQAVLEHRKALVATRTLLLHHIAGAIAKLPTEIRDQLTATGKIEARLRRLATIDPTTATTPAGAYRLAWLQDAIAQDRDARAEVRRLERELDQLLDQQMHGRHPAVRRARRPSVAV